MPFPSLRHIEVLLPTAAAGPGDPYGDAVWADTPYVWFRMDEASGNLADYMAALVATANGSPTYGQTRLAGNTGVGTSILFPSSSDFFTNAASTALDFGAFDWSLEFWLKVPALAGFPSLLGKSNSSVTDGWLCYFIASTSNVAFRGTTSDLNTNITISADETAHCVITYDQAGGQLRAYKNGVLTLSATAFTAITTGTSGFKMPHTVNAAAGVTFDEVALYRSRLSDARVLAHYTASLEVPVIDVDTTYFPKPKLVGA